MCFYRPFTKSYLYFSKDWNARIYQMPCIFPSAGMGNRMICVTSLGAKKGFSVLISKALIDLNMLEAGAQCFPLKLYEKNSLADASIKTNDMQDELVANPQSSSSTKSNTQYTAKDGITDAGLVHFQIAYSTEILTKEDVFYYIYGLLHSEDYKKRYADNLSKELPRIPCVKKASDFWIFSKAGRDLAELHLNYETVNCYPVKLDTGNKKLNELGDKDYYVEKMRFANKEDKSVVVYNNHITIKEIPLEAYEYVVNGKPALEWVMERQAVTTHKESGIVNDANLWAIETMNDAAYPLKLFQRVITVSLETMKIINALPRLDIATNLITNPIKDSTLV
ncbi:MULTISPECIES: type ISP restriction/modification enzyme [Nitrosomonas]|uniref:type ISP restriction/modification enzyme n=1 Tax=Nitrosomonas TaxID=914 RepID=UPI0021647E73|nr:MULTISPECIES: type ISP restriction/modification enzyme [Nitrosomonas]UVS63428.1 hypothetical protein NX761_11455 [Nitrosomonas sp. PLL12]